MSAVKNDDPVFRSLEVIENRISDKLKVEDIAGSVFFSINHYQRLFREIVGDSVMAYVTKRKLSLAGRELLETGASILDVALKFGFDSHEGFTRSFKAYMGVTPTDYRKYGLTAISQNTVKGKSIMQYSKTTDEIIRELNSFILDARKTSANARSLEAEPMAPYWNIIADKTDAIADNIQHTLTRVSNIAERPDEITDRFAIIKVIEDASYELNIILLNVHLTVARNLPQYADPQEPLCSMYKDLARSSALKAKKVIEFLNELAAAIFKDMRATAAEKIQAAVLCGKAAVRKMEGYDYIRNEVGYLIKELEEKPIEEISIAWLDDLLYKLYIISFTAETDMSGSQPDGPVLESLRALKDSMRDACDFFGTLIFEDPPELIEQNTAKFLMDIAYQGNIMLFYVRGEIEKMAAAGVNGDDSVSNVNPISNEQKAALEKICADIHDFIQYTHEAADESALKPIANRLYAIRDAMTQQAESLEGRGGAIKYLGEEFGRLADVITRSADL